jgi:hypothetical protein
MPCADIDACRQGYETHYGVTEDGTFDAQPGYSSFLLCIFTYMADSLRFFTAIFCFFFLYFPRLSSVLLLAALFDLLVEQGHARLLGQA